MGDLSNAKKCILLDIAHGRRNCCGDYWDVKSNVLQAVDTINYLEDELTTITEERDRLREALRLCRHHSNYSIGESEALAAQLTKIRVIAKIALTPQEPEEGGKP